MNSLKSLHKIYSRLSTGLVRLATRKEQEKIRKFKNKHKGERCFIIGNGPSLTQNDLNLVANDVTFSCNMIFDIIHNINWQPYYYFCHDPGYIRKFKKEITDIKTKTKFIGFYYDTAVPVYQQYKNVADILYYVHKPHNDYREIDFNVDVEKRIYASGSISYAMLQFAFYMGFKEIYLIGFDHNFNSKTEKTHFAGYTGNQNATVDIDNVTRGFIKTKEVADQLKVRIINCTRGGNLEVFQRKQLEEVVL